MTTELYTNGKMLAYPELFSKIMKLPHGKKVIAFLS